MINPYQFIPERVKKYLLEPCPSFEVSEKSNISDFIKVCILDTETTGLDRTNDQIIELAFKIITIDSNTGSFLSCLHSFGSFNDIDSSLDSRITRLTGITEEMLKGQFIDWDEVDNILSNVNIIIAHNSNFDRSFVDRYSKISKKKKWGCSVRDIDWRKRGYKRRRLEYLCNKHGFYYHSHRALDDVNALIYLLTHPKYNPDKPIKEIIQKIQ